MTRSYPNAPTHTRVGASPVRYTVRSVNLVSPAGLWLAAFLAALLPLPAASAETDEIAMLKRSIESIDKSGCLVAAGLAMRTSPLASAFYRRRGFEPAWTDPASVRDLIDAIGDAERQGLDPADYHVSTIESMRREGPHDPRRAADFDLIATDALVHLAIDVRYGKIPPRTPRAGPGGLPALASADPVTDLQDAISRGRIRDLVDSLEPKTVFYQRLERALETYRRLAAAGGWPAVGAGPSLKLGATDSRVPVLRERLAITGEIADRVAAGAADLYDETLVAGVRAFQARHGLQVDGVLGVGTVSALNVPVAARIDQIRATLERCRWFLRDLPDRFVMVNAAGYRVLFLEAGQMRWRSRVIVGKPYTKTPMFRANMESVILNPTWTIPASIVRNEILPATRRDPNYLAKKRISRIGGSFVQAAGPENALGRIKLDLPNPYSVYLHDTPVKSLFDSTTRTFSHGCVRVEHPVELAALALDDPAWSVEAIEAAIDTGKTRRILLRTPLPVLVLYWSVTVNSEGTVEFLPDIYRRDAPILRGLAARATSGTCRRMSLPSRWGQLRSITRTRQSRWETASTMAPTPTPTGAKRGRMPASRVIAAASTASRSAPVASPGISTTRLR